MQRIWDWLLNLQRARLGEGELSVRLTHLWPVLLSLLALAAVIASVVLIYRRDGGTRTAKIIGATLRCALLVLLLLLIWQPVIRIERTRDEPGVVAVLIDTSGSMSTRDRYLIDDPDVRARAPSTQPDELALRRVADELSGQGRLELVRRAITDDDARVVRDLLAGNDLAVYEFSTSAAAKVRLPRTPPNRSGGDDPNDPADAERLAQALAPLNDMRAEGPATSIGQAVTDVLTELRGQRVAGLIVLSDGRSTAESDLDAAVNLAHKFTYPVPVHTVTVGSIHPPRDLAVHRVLAESVVFVKDIVAVRAVIGQHGYSEPQQVTVRLVDQDDRPLAAETITVGRADGDAGVPREIETELRYQPDTPGTYQLAVRVEPPGGADMNPSNDSRTTQLEVKDAQINVLLIDGLPRWEYRFLVNSLIREKTVTLSVMLLSADEEFAQDGNAPITRLPISAEEWNRYDVILFGDVNPFDLTTGQLEQIEQFVRERGGGFAMIAGDLYSPLRYLNTPLANLLPVEIDPMAGPDRVNRLSGYKMRLTPDGRNSPVLRFERQPERNADTIAAFPEFYWFKPVLDLKPGAEVLADHPTAALADGTPAPLMVAGRYGAGRTYFSAVDSTWRWRWHTGVPFFDTYWLQLVRYLSRNKLLETDRRFELSTAQTEYELGKPVEILLQVLDRSSPQLPDTVPVAMDDGDPLSEPLTVPLRRAGRDSFLYSARVSPPGEGHYVFTLDRATADMLFGAPPPGARRASMPHAEIDVALASAEKRQLAIDDEQFPRLAARTSGRPTTLAGLEELVGQVPDLSRPINDDLSLPLWDTRLALVLFALLITAEWILRKRYNLQ